MPGANRRNAQGWSGRSIAGASIQFIRGAWYTQTRNSTKVIFGGAVNFVEGMEYLNEERQAHVELAEEGQVEIVLGTSGRRA